MGRAGEGGWKAALRVSTNGCVKLLYYCRQASCTCIYTVKNPIAQKCGRGGQMHNTGP